MTEEAAPQNLEAEQAVLGSIILDEGLLHELVGWLRPEHFYSTTHQQIYSAFLSMYEDEIPLDLLTIKEELNRGGCDQLTMERMASLVESVPSAASCVHYAGIVLEKAGGRNVLRFGQELKEMAVSGRSVDEMMGKVESFAMGMYDYGAHVAVPVSRIADDLLAEFDKDDKAPKHARGISTGYPEIDSHFLGLCPGEVTVIGGRTTEGKSAFALNIALNVTEKNKSVLMVSAEMTGQSILERAYSNIAAVSFSSVRKRVGEPGLRKKMEEATENIKRRNFHIYEPLNPTFSSIRAQAKLTKERHGLDVLIVDYVQLLEADGEHKTKQAEISWLTRAFTKLALSMNIAIVLVAQLNRNVENAKSAEPQLTHLRESGSIEQDAHNVLLLYDKHNIMKSKSKCGTMFVKIANPEIH